MANLHSRISTDASVGTTIGTFDAIDTRNGNNILQHDAKVVAGLYFSGVAADQTSATAVAGRLRFTNAGASVAAGEADFAVGETHGSGIATQSTGWWTPAEFIPYEVPPGPIGNTTCNLLFSQLGIEPGDNWSVVAGVLHGAGFPALWDWAVAGGLRFHGSASSNGAGVSATTATSLTSTTILSKYRRLYGWRPIAQADPLGTTTEETVGFAALDTAATTISGMTPMELPMPSIGPNLLGTLVGGGVFGWQKILPMYAEVPGSNDRVLDPTLNLTTAVTAANAFGYSVGLRRA